MTLGHEGAEVIANQTAERELANLEAAGAHRREIMSLIATVSHGADLELAEFLGRGQVEVEPSAPKRFVVA